MPARRPRTSRASLAFRSPERGPRRPLVPTPRGGRSADLLDRVGEGGPVGQPDRNPRAGLAPEQRAPDRRLVGDLAVLGTRLGGADDREGLRAVEALDGHRRAERGVVRARVLDDHRGLEHALERLDPALDERLLVLRLFVLRVLGKVAVLLRVVDAGGNLGATHVDEVVELLAQAGLALAREVGWLRVHGGIEPLATGRVGPSGV